MERPSYLAFLFSRRPFWLSLVLDLLLIAVFTLYVAPLTGVVTPLPLVAGLAIAGAAGYTYLVWHDRYGHVVPLVVRQRQMDQAAAGAFGRLHQATSDFEARLRQILRR